MPGHVLVTGAAGYIGRFVCHELLRAGFVPIVHDDLSRGRVPPRIVAPVEDAPLGIDSLLAIARRHRPVGAIHLAGGRGGRHAKPSAGLPEDPNIAATRILLAALASTEVGHVLLASSSAVYGDPGRGAVGEDAPLRATSAYGRAKVAAEALVRDWGSGAGRSWGILRYANAAGAAPEIDLGWYPADRTIVPTAIAAAAGERPAVELYGIRYDTADGTAVRDFIHCRDIAAATVHALQRRLAGMASEIFNVASGAGHSVLEVIGTAERASGRRIPVIRHDVATSEVPSLVLSPARLAGTGFVPRQSQIEAIVRSAWTWRLQTAVAATPTAP